MGPRRRARGHHRNFATFFGPRMLHAIMQGQVLNRDFPTRMLLALTPLFASAWLVPSAHRRAPAPSMLRNIDACELLLFSSTALLDGGDGLRAGVRDLVEEAAEQGVLSAAVRVGGAGAACSDGVLAEAGLRLFDVRAGSLSEGIAGLTALRSSLSLEPDGFGGVDGFGRAPSKGQREPLAARCVCVVTSSAECGAALGAGFRCVAVPSEAGGDVEASLEGVADAIVDELREFCIDDISTPGWGREPVFTPPARPRTPSPAT